MIKRLSLLTVLIATLLLHFLANADIKDKNPANSGLKSVNETCPLVAIFAGDLITPQKFPPTQHYERARNDYLTFVSFDMPLYTSPDWLNSQGTRHSSDMTITIPKDGTYDVDWRLAYSNDPSFYAHKLMTMLYVNGKGNYSTETRMYPPTGSTPPVGVMGSANMSLKAGDKLSLGVIVADGEVAKHHQNIGYISNSIILIVQSNKPSHKEKLKSLFKKMGN